MKFATRITAVLVTLYALAGCGVSKEELAAALKSRDDKIENLEKKVGPGTAGLIHKDSDWAKSVWGNSQAFSAFKEKYDTEKEAAEAAKKAAAKKRPKAKYIEGKPPAALLKSPLAATPGKFGDQVCAENPIVKARIKRGLPPTVPACDVEGKPGVKGVPIKNGCAEIIWSKYKDPDTGIVRVVEGLPKKTINGKDYDYKIGKVIPMDWKSCGSPRVWVDGTKQCADGHVNCVD